MRALHVLTGLTTLALTLVAVPALAGDPAVELQRQADRVVTILADRNTEPVARQREVRAIVSEAFDFEEAAKRTLGRAWAERTPEERAAFVGLFMDLIDRAYLRRLDAWDGQRIVVGDDVVDTDRATVRTAVVARDGDKTPIDYVMRRSDDGRWRVVDVNVGGASLLGNYRVQFARLMQSGGFAHLMERLQAKVASLQP
ncbi:MAG TPA: ABC transporter substrate-binding protein [Methylomirabilota bacterium]|jgi:phospholipid transport system substrate-binding protein